MKKMILVLLTSLLLLSCSEESANNKSVEVESPKVEQVKVVDLDSIKASEVVVGFYTWYAKAINSNSKELYPDFVKDSNGMSTLDMSYYLENLRDRKFSEKLIAKTRIKYKTCLDNLKNINYDTLKAKYELFEHEDIDCAFFNVNEWIADMDSHDGVDVVKTSMKGDDILIKLSLYNIDEGRKRYWDYKYINVLVTKERGQWLINDIDVVLEDINN